MTQATDTDIREIKTAIESIARATEANTKAIADLAQETRLGFASMEKKIDVGFANVDTKLTKMEGRTDTLETRVLGKFETVNAKITNLETNTKAVGDLAEKVGELKNWKQIAIVIFTATVGGAIGYYLKGGKL